MSSEESAIKIDDSGSDAALPKEPPFFSVSPTKLLLLSVCTLGLYEIYWFYKNWSLVKRREGTNILPVARSIFAYFFCYALFRRVSTHAAEVNCNDLPAGPLAVGWIVTTLLWRLPDPYWLVSFAAVLFLLPVQSAINSINAKIVPEHDRNERFGAWNVVALVVGGLVLVLVAIGTFLPAEQV